MSINDVYELTLHQTMRGQKIANVFHYQQRAVIGLASGNTAAAIAGEFWGVFGDTWKGIVTSDVRFDRIASRNLFSPPDVAEFVIDQLGNNGGAGNVDSLPTFVAVAYTLFHDQGSLLKKGAKRVSGLNDGAVTDGIIVDTDYADALTILGAKFGTPLQWGTLIRDDVWFPIVVQRVQEVVAGKTAYRLPAVLAELVFGTITSAVFGLEVGSQVSRRVKLG